MAMFVIYAYVCLSYICYLSRLIYITDWYATILGLAGVKDIPSNLDSFDLWKSLSSHVKSPREEIILNLDQDSFWNTWSAAIM